MTKIIGATVACVLAGVLVGTSGEASHGAAGRAAVLDRPVLALGASPSGMTAPGQAAGASSDACGTRPRKTDGTYWSCTFADDFSKTRLDTTKWVAQEVYAEGNLDGAYTCYHDDPSLVSVSGGALHLSLRRTAVAQPCVGSTLAPTVYSAGSVSTHHLFSQQYGRFEARVRSTATTQPGLHEAFWLWPDDREASTDVWPAAGEIDVAETYSNWSAYAVPFLHYGAGDNGGIVPGLNTNLYCAARRGDWNTYTLEWSATRIEILVNGRSCLVNTSGDVAFMKKYIVALTQGMGSNTNSYVGTAPLPATTDVDYVRVWR
jgi:beta-glucanase (GH16 family)